MDRLRSVAVCIYTNPSDASNCLKFFDGHSLANHTETLVGELILEEAARSIIARDSSISQSLPINNSKTLDIDSDRIKKERLQRQKEREEEKQQK